MSLAQTQCILRKYKLQLERISNTNTMFELYTSTNTKYIYAC